MNTTTSAMIGLVLWSVLMTFAVLAVRVRAVREGRKQMNEFQADGRDLDALGLRVTRAHANSLEYLAIPVALMLLAISGGHSALTDGLAMVVLASRIGQSTVHMLSTSPRMVMLRGTLFSVQVLVWIVWSVRLLAAG